MFGWLQDLLRSIVDAIKGGFASAAKAISDSIWNAMMRWLYNNVYSAIADFFTMMGNMGAEIFDLAWIRAIVQLFTLFGWGLFAAGVVVAIFDLAVEYQSGRANIKNALLNILKGFFACSLIGLVPIELYKFCISLQNTFAGELVRIFSWQSGIDFSSRATIVLGNTFAPLKAAGNLLLNVCLLIAFAYCVIKVFFQNIKRCLTSGAFSPRNSLCPAERFKGFSNFHKKPPFPYSITLFLLYHPKSPFTISIFTEFSPARLPDYGYIS